MMLGKLDVRKKNRTMTPPTLHCTPKSIPYTSDLNTKGIGSWIGQSSARKYRGVCPHNLGMGKHLLNWIPTPKK